MLSVLFNTSHTEMMSALSTYKSTLANSKRGTEYFGYYIHLDLKLKIFQTESMDSYQLFISDEHWQE